MKILLLGSNGTLGQSLLKILSAENEIFPLTRKDVDITDHKKINNKIKEISPEIIINASGHTNVDAAEDEEKDLAYIINAHAVSNIARLSFILDIPFVHFSTDYIFDGEKEEGYKEDDTANPLNIYGHSKHLGEKAVQDNTEKHYIIRLSRLFGESGISENSKKNFVELMLDLAKTKKELDVVNDATSNVTHASDLSEAVKKIIEEKYPYGVYHITNEGSNTFYDFAKKIFKIKNIDIKVNPVNSSKFPRPAKIPKNSSLINTKFPKLRHWEEALKEHLNKK